MVILGLRLPFYISFYKFFFQLSDFSHIYEFLICFSCFRHLVATSGLCCLCTTVCFSSSCCCALTCV